MQTDKKRWWLPLSLGLLILILLVLLFKCWHCCHPQPEYLAFSSADTSSIDGFNDGDTIVTNLQPFDVTVGLFAHDGTILVDAPDSVKVLLRVLDLNGGPHPFIYFIGDSVLTIPPGAPLKAASVTLAYRGQPAPDSPQRLFKFAPTSTVYDWIPVDSAFVKEQMASTTSITIFGDWNHPISGNDCCDTTGYDLDSNCTLKVYATDIGGYEVLQTVIPPIDVSITGPFSITIPDFSENYPLKIKYCCGQSQQIMWEKEITNAYPFTTQQTHGTNQSIMHYGLDICYPPD